MGKALPVLNVVGRLPEARPALCERGLGSAAAVDAGPGDADPAGRPRRWTPAPLDTAWAGHQPEPVWRGPARMTMPVLESAGRRVRPLLPGNQAHRPHPPRMKCGLFPGVLGLTDGRAEWFHVKRAAGSERQPACPTARFDRRQ